MLTVEQIYDIREMYFKEGKSMREISRLSGRDRETIKRYVEQEDFSIEVPIRQRRSSKTDAYREQVRQCGNLAFGRPPSRSLKAIRAGREGHPARTWKAIS